MKEPGVGNRRQTRLQGYKHQSMSAKKKRVGRKFHIQNNSWEEMVYIRGAIN